MPDENEKAETVQATTKPNVIVLDVHDLTIDWEMIPIFDDQDEKPSGRDDVAVEAVVESE